MKRCIYCGRDNNSSNKYCSYCGEALDTNEYGQTQDDQIVVDSAERNEHKRGDAIYCTKCGSSELVYITRESGGYDNSSACCGLILFGPLGLLCGLTSNKESQTIRKCRNCGNEF